MNLPSPIAYFNGQYVSPAGLLISVHDPGFLLGATVSERLRTFAGRPFRMDDHLARLARSLEIVGIEPPVPVEQMGTIALRVAEHNHRLLAAGDDLAVILFLTPGLPASANGPPRATLGIHTQPLEFHAWAEKYATGESLIVSSVRQVPGECWPSELKCRSRMHYYLADREARRIDPAARALLLDADGFVSEASTANVLAYFAGEGLVSPRREKILPGITAAVVQEMARELGVAVAERDVRPEELFLAEEVLLTSTSPCVLPVTNVNGKPIGDGKPGRLFHRLVEKWNVLAGLDVIEQAKRFSRR